VFHVYVSLADFGGDPLSGILIEAVATPAVKKSGTSVHSNAPERAYTGVDGTCTLNLLSIPGVWYQIRPVHSKGVFNPVNLAGYVPDVDDPTTGEVFPADTEINLKDVVDEDPTPGYEGLVYSGPPNVLTIGTVTTGAPGSDADADIGGVSPSQTLDLVIPRGDVGPKGDTGDSQLLEPGPNRFNAATVTLEFRVNHTTGALVAAAGWWASDFIPVAASSPYWTKVSWYRAYYDDSQTFISGVNVGSITGGTTFTTPAGAAYVRDSHFEQSRIATQVVAEGSTSRPWTAYQLQVPPEILREVTPSVLVTDAATGATLGDALASLAVVAGPPANAFNPATVTDGFYFNTTTGVMTAGADWHTSDFIPVTAGNAYAGNLVWYIAWFTRAQVFISGSNLTPQGAKTFTAPAGAVYARFSWFGSTAPSIIVFRAGTSAVLPPIPYTAASVDASLIKHTATLNLPATIPALVGAETNLYFDGIVGGDYALYDVDINCSIGTQQAERWTVVPASAGTYALTFDLYRDGVGVARATTSVVVKAAAVGTGITKSVVVIGDSLIDNATSPPTVLPTLFGAGDPMDITMLGTRGTGPGLHEGRSGWSTTTYTTLATSGGVTNAFWDGSAFSFPAWKTAQGYATVDYAIVNLGINDVFSAATDAEATTAITTALAQLGTMVTSITGTGTKVGICVTTPPARSQDAFGASYGSGQTRWRYRRNLAAWNTALIATFGGRTAEGIYLLPTNAALDTVNNFPTTTAAVNARNATTSARQNNGVHCSSNGSAQIADVMHHWIKGFES
jgi:lysophospholipase L1-like esterase